RCLSASHCFSLYTHRFLLPHLLFFFLYCYLDPRDLHSFPTRRSSDLICDLFAGLRIHDNHLRGSACADKQPVVFFGTRTPPQMIDRKSTRLNSSHVKISYAVFCLKKKKKTQNNRKTYT